MTEVCTPGQRLGLVTEFGSGPGTYITGKFVCASLVGLRHTVQPEDTAQQALPVLQVRRASAPDPVPAAGDVVTARVTRLTPRLALADILCVGDSPCARRYSGVIRLQDVRATEIDAVRLPACFRPGDLVRAEVLSLGDARSYFLTTAKNELGVVYATSIAAGAPMVPLSWQEMQCPVTNSVESRKVARVARVVLLTVGTTRFDALVDAVDCVEVAEALADRGYTHLVLQIGAAARQGSRLLPPGSRRGALPCGLQVEWFDYTPSLAGLVSGAALVISHAGAGSVFEALGAGAAVVAVPNPLLMDDHQAELARKLEGMGVLVAASLEDLPAVLARAEFRGLRAYVPGDPTGMVAAVDALMGVRDSRRED